MACPCLVEGRKVCCTAVEGELIPSLHERERYCRTDHSSCPTYALFALRDRRLAQEEYYSIWTDEPPVHISVLRHVQTDVTQG